MLNSTMSSLAVATATYLLSACLSRLLPPSLFKSFATMSSGRVLPWSKALTSCDDRNRRC